ncbi:MAG: dihydroxyacetone kinase subunit DhaK, partial [Verrucomicrobiia bacterium]
SNIAMQMAKKAGLNVKSILTHEDIAPGANAPAENRRGLVGCIPLYKIAGAAAEAGKSLDEVLALAERFNNNMATLAVALTTATHPASGQSIFALADDEMEIGMGQHGEAGTGRSKMKSANETAEIMVTQLIEAVKAKAGDKVLVIINGAGSTTLMEQFIVMRRVGQVLAQKGVVLARARVGEYLTVQEMGGFQMFVAKMDDEMLKYWDAPCDAPYMTVR